MAVVVGVFVLVRYGVAAASGTPGGLPVGLQIVGPRYEDDTPVTLAELLADVTGGYQPPPGPGAAAPADSPSSAFR
jgi:hypothetical protein